jgi:Transglutaminase-like superfamily
MNHFRHSIREDFLFKAGLALNVLIWLFTLPALLHVHTIPKLLKRLAAGRKEQSRSTVNFNDAVGIVTRICNLRPFRARIFPKLCLRQSLALYRTLTQMGYPVQIHFGVRKNDKTFSGHSWVTLRGEAVADTTQSGIFKAVYSYPAARRALSCPNRKVRYR